ncbi:hypothetical protein SKAU_G00233530 [Synaphobranchus kaupii]|uniref:Uncharacterized protein n=1 Tax=Synaphobranchus kaupii TaxID=118154 RepID=A0A9Q1F623_SYNKA|nr:hypothetical protein SKAU_G00233530 [Synaphobranchus kaupii]
MADAASAVKSLRMHLQHCREEEESWDGMWSQVKEFCQDVAGVSSPAENDPTTSSKWKRISRPPLLLAQYAMASTLGQRFSDEAMALSVACDAVMKCDKKGISPLLNTYAGLNIIHPQFVTAEMDLLKTYNRIADHP